MSPRLGLAVRAMTLVFSTQGQAAVTAAVQLSNLTLINRGPAAL
jgi:hypothetical protein